MRRPGAAAERGVRASPRPVQRPRRRRGPQSAQLPAPRACAAALRGLARAGLAGVAHRASGRTASERRIRASRLRVSVCNFLSPWGPDARLGAVF